LRCPDDGRADVIHALQRAVGVPVCPGSRDLSAPPAIAASGRCGGGRFSTPI